MFFGDFDGLRRRLASSKLPALVLSLMLIAVIGAVLAVSTARSILLRSRTALPGIVQRVPWLASSYLDRAAITEQVIDPPELVRALLWPVLGSPALLDLRRLISSGTLDIFVMNGRKVEEKIASVGVGSFVGERSLLTGEPRSATARAAGDCSVFVVGKPTMGELLREHPMLAEQIAQIMAERDERREQLTRDLSHDRLSEAANTLLQRIRAFFAID